MPDRLTPLPVLAPPDPWLQQAALQPRPAILDAILDSDSENDDEAGAHKLSTIITSSPTNEGKNSRKGGASIVGEDGINPFDFRESGVDLDEFVMVGWDPNHVLYETLEYYASQVQCVLVIVPVCYDAC